MGTDEERDCFNVEIRAPRLQYDSFVTILPRFGTVRCAS
jgi:hypothetical protein